MAFEDKKLREIKDQIMELNQKFQEIGGSIDDEMEEKLEEYKKMLSRKWELAKDKGKKVEEYVNENPWKSVGTAFGMGVLVGWLMRNKDR